jgi:group I intron endonuclease
MKMFIYTLEDPITMEIRYVGKTKNLKDRLWRHLAKCYLDNDKNLHKTRWIKQLLKRGLSPVMKIIEECNIQDVNFLEQYWISQFKTWGFKLTNMSLGGEIVGNWKGKKHSEETKLKLRKINSKIIIEYDLNGKILNKYLGVPEAAKLTGLHKTSIYRCCNKKTHHKTKNRTFRYDGDPFDYVPFNKHIQKNSKQILKYDKNNHVIKEYSSIQEAADDNLMKAKTLFNHLKHNKKYINPLFVSKIINKKKVYLDYYFTYKENYGTKINKEYKYYAPNKGIASIHGKSVIQKDKSFKIIATYKSITEASKSTGIFGSNISNCCLKKPKNKTAGGFIWEFNVV